MYILDAGQYREMTPQELAAYEEAQLAIEQDRTRIQLEAIRIQRNGLLAQTDWTTLPDSPLSAEKKAEYQVYRQALRDMMDGLENAEDAVFPDKPE